MPLSITLETRRQLKKTARQIKDGTLNSLYIGEGNTPSFILLEIIQVIIVELSSTVITAESSSRVTFIIP